VADDPIISVSGLRGIVGKGLTPQVACRYAAAFSEGLPDGPLLITRDGRANGMTLMTPMCSHLAFVGRDVLGGGIAATPTVGVMVRHLRAVGGIQITASHNPAEYNGMKLFAADGRVIPADVGEDVLDRYRVGGRSRVLPPQRLGITIPVDDMITQHLKLVLATVDADRIRARGFRVLLDANHGAGSVLARRLLEELGCQVTLLGGEPDGRFAHPPEPTAEYLASVLPEVARAGADVGFCQDPDADRLAIIDEGGHYIGEECTLALCVELVLSRTPGPVVTNCSTSRMTEDLARKYGVPFYRSAVGEAHVVDEMLRCRAVLGGEGNGGVIDPRVGLVRDSFVGMALVLDALAAREMSTSALAGELPQYAICKTKLQLPADRIEAAFDALERHFDDAVPDRLDGLRLDWADDPETPAPSGQASPSGRVSPRLASASRRDAATRGRWLLVRPSNTEPIVRLVAEAPTDEQARHLCDEAAGVIAAD
jgi:phosphomannomutase